MPPIAAFRLSTYLTLGVASACLGYAEYPILPEAGVFAAVVIVSLVALYRMESRVAMLSISDANKLGAGIMLVSVLWGIYRLVRETRVGQFESLGTQYLGVALFGPILLAAIPAKLLRKDKHAGDYWAFHLIALVAVTLSGAMANDAVSMVLIAAYAVCAVWNLALFLPARVTGVVPPIPPRASAAPDAAPPTPARAVEAAAGRRPTLSPVLGWVAVAGAVAVPLFMLTPRSPFGRVSFGAPSIEVGFAAEQMIDLNRAGNLQANPEVAFEVEATDVAGTVPKDDLNPQQRWRGAVLVEYARGNWRTPQTPMPAVRADYRPSPVLGFWFPPQFGPEGYRLVLTVPNKLRADVVADPLMWLPDHPIPLVGLGPTGRSPWQVDVVDGTIYRPKGLASLPGRDPQYEQYTRPPVEPDLGPGFELSSPLNLDDLTKHRPLVHNPVPRVKEYADQLLARLIREGKLPAGAAPQPKGDDPIHLWPPREAHEAIARAFSEHLGRDADLQYSTKLRRENKTLDPVEEFLFHSRVGHCERFASALALMLRSQGIPAVLVLGFKGCERVGPGRYVVRQEHAHAWVEALVSRPVPDPPPRGVLRARHESGRMWHWLSLDPQPGGESVGEEAARRGWWAELGTLFRHYFLDYSSENRAKLLRHLGELLAEPAVLGGVGGVLALGLLVSRLRRRDRSANGGARSESGRWFEQLLVALAAHGYAPRPGQTPREFAGEVSESLRAHPQTAPHADVPVAWADAYYGARFGGEPIPDDRRAELEARLAELRRALPGTPSPSHA